VSSLKERGRVKGGVSWGFAVTAVLPGVRDWRLLLPAGAGGCAGVFGCFGFVPCSGYPVAGSAAGCIHPFA
jgi:hypothetical protein